MIPIHPGKILERELKSRKQSVREIAAKLYVPVTRLYKIIHGHQRLSAEMALRLGQYFETDPQFWMNLQANYDLAFAKDRFGAAIARVKSRRSNDPP